jgi:hypothetical protein
LKNPVSVANRINAMKKKHNIPIMGSIAGLNSKKEAKDPTAPVTPSKVTKSRGKARAKKGKALKSESSEDDEKKVKSESDDEAEDDGMDVIV